MKKLLLKLKLFLIERKKGKISKHEMARLLIKQLDPYYVTRSIDSGELKAPFKSLPELTKLLKEINVVFSLNGTIKSDPLNITFTQVNIDTYIGSDGGYYSDPVKAIKDFKSEVKTLCMFLKDKEGVEFGKDEHNRRMVEKYLDFTIQLCNVLLKK